MGASCRVHHRGSQATLLMCPAVVTFLQIPCSGLATLLQSAQELGKTLDG
jgi:hypothetical protein